MVITGLVDAGINVTDFKGNVVATAAAANGSATSNFTFLITEDIGGGMKARARWEIDPDLNNTVGRTSGTSASGTTSNVTAFLGNGESFLALDSGIGTISFGANNLRALIANGIGNSGFSTAIGSGYRVSSFDAVRFQNSLRYETPNINGFTASALVVTKNNLQVNGANTAGGNNVNQIDGRDGASEFGLAYNNGPVAAQYSTLRVTQDATANPTLLSNAAGTAANTTTATAFYTPSGAAFNLDTLAASYNFGAASVAGFYQRVKSDSLSRASLVNGSAQNTQVFDRTTVGVSGSFNATPALTLRANYQRVTLGDSDTSANTYTASTGALATNRGGLSTNVLGLGADYALSKRSSLYFRYESNQDDAGVRSITGYTAAAGNTTYTATALGIRHTF